MLHITAANCPQTVIFEGDMSAEKAAHLRHLAAEILYENRREKDDSRALVSTLIHEGRHPDLVEFTGESLLIGPEKDPPPGTVRHLLRRILPYAPWKSHARVVIFQNAGGIKDEAETALLKTLEEPAAQHFFFLSAQAAEELKETIRSRSVITRVVNRHVVPEGMTDPWQRFYYLMGAKDFIAQWPEATERITGDTRQVFDELAFTADDFAALERVLFLLPRQLFDKESVTMQGKALRFAVLPLLAALRDRATQGVVAPFSPLVLNRMTPGQAVEASNLVHTYLRQLEHRVFGNRPLNLHAVFYSFFFRFMLLWSPA
ncbi:MAG: hypothetical protein ACOY5B_01505 [Spirochaetota bacterium]